MVDSDPQVNGKRITIVGVVGDAKQISLRDSDTAEIYFPYAQQPEIFGTLVVRDCGRPMSLADQCGRLSGAWIKTSRCGRFGPWNFWCDRDREGDRLLMTLMGGFGALAVILTALGTYGVLSNTVNQRRREIGIRMALGAGRGVVRNMVMSQGMKLVLAGCAIGLVVAVAALANDRKPAVWSGSPGYRRLWSWVGSDAGCGVSSQLSSSPACNPGRSCNRFALRVTEFCGPFAVSAQLNKSTTPSSPSPQLAAAGFVCATNGRGTRKKWRHLALGGSVAPPILCHPKRSE